MILLHKRYPGLLACCDNCYALIGYDPDDVSSKQQIQCPQCGYYVWVPLDPNYDGTVKESEDKKDEKPVV